MTHDDDTNALFERVLDVLARAAGDDLTLLALLSELPSDTRAMALIRTLLIADTSLRATFAAGELAQRDSALAVRAALALAEFADRAEANLPASRQPLRLGELSLGCGAA